jgi:nucleoside-diphosphate-sugar epimerase
VARSAERSVSVELEERWLRLLVVGATGGLGRDIVAAALAGGHETAALARDPARAELPEVVEIVQGDVLDPGSLAGMVRDRDAVICALGTPSPRRPSSLLEERPGRFVAGRPRGHLRVIREGEQGRLGRVVRADLARFLVHCATSGKYVREAVAVGS